MTEQAVIAQCERQFYRELFLEEILSSSAVRMTAILLMVMTAAVFIYVAVTAFSRKLMRPAGFGTAEKAQCAGLAAAFAAALTLAAVLLPLSWSDGPQIKSRYYHVRACVSQQMPWTVKSSPQDDVPAQY